MAFIHSEFMLPVYLAEAGEAPKPGAFFATAKGSNLSKIAKAAYNDPSAWKVINANAWNTANCVYRQDSTDCGSKKQDPTMAKNTVSPTASAKSAYIALCPKDTKQHPAIIPATTFKYPVIWIPDLANMSMPVFIKERVEEPKTDPVVLPKTVIKDFGPKTTPVNPNTPAKKGTLYTPSGGGGGGTTPSIIPQEPQKAGMGPWLLLALGVVAVIGVIAMPSKKVKK